MTVAGARPSLRLKAPIDSGHFLVQPSRDLDGESMVAGQWLATAKQRVSLCGKNLASVRDEARREVLSLAARYVASYSAEPFDFAPSENAPLIIAGHQPELFHPGVWFKNFLLDELAKQTDGIALNLIVDNDLCRSIAVKVPGRDAVGNITFESVPWDLPRQATPWETRCIASASTFESFPQRIRRHLLTEVDNPLVDQLWAKTEKLLERPLPVGTILAQARHALERACGLNTLELPLSSLTSTRSFARFSLQIMHDLATFRKIYNWHRDTYRRANHVRSAAHPVPALQERAGWIEGPWWVYRAEVPRRQALFLYHRQDSLLLSDRNGWQVEIEGPIDSEQAIDQWMELLEDEVFIRPRALLTTMFARMVIGDLFVHGIGGGKYDQLTDAILSEYFGCAAPPYLVATATMHLPIDVPKITDQEIREQQNRIWQLRHHPEQFLTIDTPETRLLLDQRRNLLDHMPEKGKKWNWHRELVDIHRRLETFNASQIEDVQRNLDQLSSQMRIRNALQSREFSFCLFPAQLIDQLRKLAHNACQTLGYTV